MTGKKRACEKGLGNALGKFIRRCQSSSGWNTMTMTHLWARPSVVHKLHILAADVPTLLSSTCGRSLTDHHSCSYYRPGCYSRIFCDRRAVSQWLLSSCHYQLGRDPGGLHKLMAGAIRFRPALHQLLIVAYQPLSGLSCL